jgi:hypothetical protein
MVQGFGFSVKIRGFTFRIYHERAFGGYKLARLLMRLQDGVGSALQGLTMARGIAFLASLKSSPAVDNDNG